jgi:DnaJ-domain-containing protein 1
MDLPALYDEDLHAWALHQAEALRRLRASGASLPNDLDLEHVAEEIEDLGNEQRFQVESNLENALAHLIKAAALPGNDAIPHWLVEVNAFLGKAAQRWRPSMRRAMDLPKLWGDVCHQAGTDLSLHGHPVPPLPPAMPFTLDDLVKGRADPRALADRMAAALRDAAAP